MLSDAADAPVNNVIMYTAEEKAAGSLKPVDVTFDTSIAQFNSSVEKTSCQKCSKRARNQGT